MAIDYKAAYQSIYASYRELLRERMQTAALPALIDWIGSHDRGPAITSFTEGPERNIAYAVETALHMERETAPVFPVRPIEQCPRCWYGQIAAQEQEKKE